MPELGWFAVAVGAVLVVGLAVGMLLAPAMTRWSERDGGDDEDPGAGSP
ncbi:MAG TPA: hypothetical protein VM344_05135 [Vitreimonas sp.]|nr:hypothetical protein [Vitreimonas sp.]